MKKTFLSAMLTVVTMVAYANNTLRIGIEGAYPPFSAVNENGELFGFDVDIAKALCDEMQMTCELVKIDWDSLIPSLNNEKIDAIVASMSATEERKKSVDFTDKYYSNNGRLVVKKTDAEKITQTNWETFLQGKVLGVQTSTVHDIYATDKLKNIVKSIERYNTQDDANVDLQAGRIDATLADHAALATGFLKTKAGTGYVFAEPVFNDVKYYGTGVAIAVRKGDTQLVDKLNKAIKTIRENKTYQTINDRYFDFDIYQ